MNRAIRPQFVRRCACLIALPLALAACGEKEQPADKAEAAGEILPGTISDAMLPLDSVRSQPPLVPPKSTAKADAAKDAEDGEMEAEASGDDTTAAGAPETPAATPAPDAGATATPTATPAPTTKAPQP